MATYPVINKETGEQKEVVMSVNDWDQWREDNPDWTRDYSDPSTMPGVGEVGEWKDKLRKANLVGMMFCEEQVKLQGQGLRNYNASQKKIRTNRYRLHSKTNEKEKTYQ